MGTQNGGSMTGRVHSFESFGTVDGPGIRFVLFLQGCPMRCKYCHNPDTWDFAGGKEYTAEEVAARVLKYKSYFTGGGGVTVSGGEPLLQKDFVAQLFSLLKEKGIHTALDTSGATFTEEKKESFLPLLDKTDLVLLDLKEIDEEKHLALTGKSNRHALAFAKFLNERKIPVWIRHVLVPFVTDFDEDLRRLREFIDTMSNVERVEVLPYHTMGKVKYENLRIPYPLGDTRPPEKERVENAKRILGDVR